MSQKHCESLIYANKPVTIDELCTNIEPEITAISADLYLKIVKSWVQRLNFCKRARGVLLKKTYSIWVSISYKISWGIQKWTLFLFPKLADVKMEWIFEWDIKSYFTYEGNRYLYSRSTDYYFFTCFKIFFFCWIFKIYFWFFKKTKLFSLYMKFQEVLNFL